MIVESTLLSAIPGVRHAFFTREGGISEGIYSGLNGGLGSDDVPDNISENRRRMADALDVPVANLLSVHQIHSPDVVVASEPWDTSARPKVDAIVTKRPGLALGVTTADCGPVLMVDPKARVIGAAHAGWKGALTGVLESTLDAMEKQGAQRDGIHVVGEEDLDTGEAVGRRRRWTFEQRAIGVEQREVGGVLHGNLRFFASASRDGHAMFDLAGYIRERLQAAGVLMIDDVDLCTYADEDRFYSFRRSTHRKEADYGRHVHAIVLEE